MCLQSNACNLHSAAVNCGSHAPSVYTGHTHITHSPRLEVIHQLLGAHRAQLLVVVRLTVHHLHT